MKKIFKNGLLMLITLVAFASCKKEGTLDADLGIIDRNVITNTEIDDWLDANFLNPYNIETKYRFDRFELALNKNITPPKESQVIPAMEMVRDVWIKPYEAMGGATFIKKYSPKQFVLAGSAEYNVDGTITLGTAEGGRKVVLYVINNFDKTNRANVAQMMQTIQHEYAHILNQTVDYPTDYQTISRGGYVANWTQEPLGEGRELGFITQYARSAPGEDFAEMVANMLMMGQVTFNGIVNAVGEEGREKLRKKEQMVVDYYKTAFNIDFYALQTEVQNALAKISQPVLHTMFGFGVGYSTLYSNPLNDPNQSPEFLALWNTSRLAVAKQNYILKDMLMTFKADNIMTLRFSFTNASGATTYYGDADYSMTKSASGIVKFTLLTTQPAGTTYSNMGVINASMASVNNYIKNNQFKIDWINQIIPGPIGVAGSLGAFYKVSDTDSYFYGVLGQ